MNIQEIIGLPIVNMDDGSRLGSVTNIVMDQNLTHVKRIQLAQNRFIILDDVVSFTGSAILVKNSRVVKTSPKKGQSAADKNLTVLSPEAGAANWWLQVQKWDESL